MSKTIRVIDLLNKIANGEEVPIEIEYNNKRYVLNKTCKQYYEKGEGSYLENKLAFANTIEHGFYGDFLNDEVEIIEEQEEIDIQGIKEINKSKETNIWNKMSDCEDTINELVQAVKKLDRKIEEK